MLIQDLDQKLLKSLESNDSKSAKLAAMSNAFDEVIQHD